ncbi:MAG: YggT family protein [Chloroflexota bacterium]|nr:YggT family protein [Chloroflexota bacterium]
MRIEETRETYVEEPTHAVHDEHSHTAVTYRPGPVAMVERLIIWIFGLIQLLILLRIVLLVLAAREGNPVVAFVYDVSEIFVFPFRGILGRDQIPAGETALDVSAIVALVGWTILELIILGLIRVFRPAHHA